MIVSTLFQHDGRFETGEVEVKLLPGVPQLHVVGLPDAGMREYGIKMKSALRSCGLEWPQGHQIVVNLRPSHFRKESAGVDLAITLGFLALTGQLADPIRTLLEKCVVYGEVALLGNVFAPADCSRALRACGERPLLTGKMDGQVREGQWWELADLRLKEAVWRTREFDWSSFWRAPELPDLELPEGAAQILALATHMKLNVLVAGPQGSGKTTWAKALYALTPPPELPRILELADIFGDEVFERRWRPLESPHHSSTPQALIGGGLPPQPGVISRAHGGVLLLDEFLEFHPHVLESLREPIENGSIEIARKGTRLRWPAKFQLVATTNLCPCGRLNPAAVVGCNYSLMRCRSVCFRLSGPLMDRFDVLLFSHKWLDRGAKRVHIRDVRGTIDRMAAFAAERGEVLEQVPEWLGDLELSHRRRRSVLRVARALADEEASAHTQDRHFHAAYDLVVSPMDMLKRLFG